MRRLFGPTLGLVLAASLTAACTVDPAIEALAAPDRAGAAPTAPGLDTPTASPPPQPTPSPTPTLGPLQTGADGVGDPYYPQLGNAGYQVERYVLDLSWDPATAELAGSATLEAAALVDLASFNVDLQGMTIDAVTVDDVDAAFTREGSEVQVLVPSGIASGARFVAVFAYSGTPGPLPSMSGFDIGGWNTGERLAYVAGEPASGMSWHPANEHPTDPANYRIEMTVPTGLRVVTNGMLLEEIDEGDGTTTFVSETTAPQASYLTTLAIGDFVAIDLEPVNGVTLRSWFERSVEDAAPLFGELDSMITAFEGLFGPYPFDSYGVLVVDADLGYALETQTLSIFGNGFLRGGPIDNVVAHELAHQWFGDSIRLAEWDDIWLNEGFATYAELLYAEATTPDYDIDAAAEALARSGNGLYGPPGDPGSDKLFDQSVYARGALTLHALRRTIGDEDFFTLLRAWVERFGGHAVTTEDFVALGEEISGQQLGDFFDTWLYQEAQPELPG